MSRYGECEIRTYLIFAIVGFERRKERESKGGTPLHRKGVTIKRGTKFKKMSWYSKVPDSQKQVYQPKFWGPKKVFKEKTECANDPPSTPVFIQRTPGGTLASTLREIKKDINMQGQRRVKVVEEGGKTIQELLTR